MKHRLNAWYLGFNDGLEQPYELTSGMTWEHDQSLNIAYDRGVNAGQLVGPLVCACRAFRVALRTAE